MKYLVQFTATLYGSLEIEASSAEDAAAVFNSMDKALILFDSDSDVDDIQLEAIEENDDN